MGHELISWISARSWVIQIILVFLFAAILLLLESFLNKKLYPRLKSNGYIWDHNLLAALHKPLQILLMVSALFFAVDIIVASHPAIHMTTMFGPIRDLIVLALVVWFLFRYINNYETSLLQRKGKEKKLNKTTVHALSHLLQIMVLIASGLVVMQILGVPITGILAFGSVGTLIVGFAGKEALANIFGGIMIYTDRPFEVGDWIRSPDRDIEGVVEYIGWRLCRIRTFDKRPLYIPNSVFSSIVIENPSRMTNRRIKMNIGVRYNDAKKIAGITEAVETMLRSHDDIDSEQTLMVTLVNFAPSSLEFMVYTFTKTTDWVEYQKIQQDVFLKIITIIDEHDAQCAFPTATLHVPDGIIMKEANARECL